MTNQDSNDILRQVNDLLNAGAESDPSPEVKGALAREPQPIDPAMVVQPFNRQMLEFALQVIDVQYLRSRHDEFVVQFETSEETGIATKIWLSAEGTEENFLSIRAYGDRQFRRNEAGKLLLAVNKWNNQMRWPKAVMQIDDENDYCYISLETDLVIDRGIHLSFLTRFIERTIYGSFSFWKWATIEQGIR